MTAEQRTMELTPDEALVLAQFVAEENGGEPGDYMDGDEMDNGLVLTRDPFDTFDGRTWAACCAARRTVVDGQYPALYYGNVQVRTGQPRVALWVIDFGHVRACYTI